MAKEGFNQRAFVFLIFGILFISVFSATVLAGTVSFDFPVWTNFPNEPETLAPSGIQAGGTVTCVFPAPITNCA